MLSNYICARCLSSLQLDSFSSVTKITLDTQLGALRRALVLTLLYEREHRDLPRVFFSQTRVIVPPLPTPRSFVKQNATVFPRSAISNIVLRLSIKFAAPRQCNCYRVQVNNDFAQNTGSSTRIAPLYECVGTYEIARSMGVGGEEEDPREAERRGTEAQNVEAIY